MDHSRTTSWDDPIELGRSARELAGIDFLQGLIDEQRRVPIGATLGFALVDAAGVRRSPRREWRTARAISMPSPPQRVSSSNPRPAERSGAIREVRRGSRVA